MTQSVETLVDLLRHGEPEGGRRFRGAIDDPLSALGKEQMLAATAGIETWQSITSSPLQRCCSFASEMAEARQLPFAIDANWQEMSFGRWEGQRVADVAEHELRAFYRDAEANAPPGGEPLKAFFDRVGTAWAQRVAEADGGHHLIVTHGGVIRAVLANILSMPLASLFHIDVPYASLTRIRIVSSTDWPTQVSLHRHG